MKKFIWCFPYILMFVCTVETSAQYSSRMNDKLYEYQRMERRGIAGTVIGTGLIIAGSILTPVGIDKIRKEDDPESTTGFPEAVLGSLSLLTGVICIIPGAIEWHIGHKKTKEYQILIDQRKTGLLISPGYAGIKLAINF
ncbi:MAG TPA: hypothetical protein PLV06_04230 [Bacteroidales bacterium]|nr:hypothetical protein [Bacteroidales bacterium]HPF01871.1 hypothetical protein [Bacteroidales bacterium]HPJ58240.1 hypothetical protein [Bacteroidales bacterium]HPR11571.1 hypothetical protein [Bacteroidales bacterium]HRW84313.1 hypothetical protein [Bacteroidales bacterium]